DLQAVALRVAELSTGAGEASVATALSAASAMLDGPEARGSINRQIFVVCDRQARSWKEVSDANARSLRGSATRIAVLPVGGMTEENVAVESVELVSPPAIRGQG